MPIIRYFLLTCLIALSFQGLNTLRVFDIRWRRAACSMTSKVYMSFFNCTINEFPRNRGNYITVLMKFKQKIEKIALDFRVSMPTEINNDMELIKFRADGCYMSKRKSANPVVTATAKQLLQAGNFSGECPLAANVTYAIEHLALNPDFFPGYTPEMNFTLKINMFVEKVQILAATAVASVTKKKK